MVCFSSVSTYTVNNRCCELPPVSPTHFWLLREIQALAAGDVRIAQIIPGDATLRAVSQTCQVLRSLALRRLSSQTAALDFTLAGCRSNVPAEFLKGRNRRSIGLTRKIVINVNSPESQDLVKTEEYRSFLSDAVTFVGRCQKVQRATLREAIWLDNNYHCEVVDWTKRVLTLPRLAELFIDPCGRHLFRSTPDDEHLAAVETATGTTSSAGLECLSVQAVSNGIYRYDYSQFTQLIRSVLGTNVRSLSRLWFNGPELTEAMLKLPDGCLSDMRLKSLSIRNLGAHEDFVRVFGLQLRPEVADGILVSDDAVTNLEYLYLSDGNYPADPELQLLQYMRTPQLKSLHLGAQMLQPVTDPRRLSGMLSAFLASFSSLERFGTSRVKDASDVSYRSLLGQVAVQHSGLKTLAVWYSWFANANISDSRLMLGEGKKLENIEMLCESTSGDQGLLATLALVYRKECSLASLFLGHRFFEQDYWAADELCVMVSTILYVQQMREDPSLITGFSFDENQLSPRIETPARRALLYAIKDTGRWRLSNLWSRISHKAGAIKYLNALAEALPARRCKWLAKLPDWDKPAKKNKDAIAMGLYNAITRRLPDGFNRLEVAVKEDNRRMPKEIRDRRFSSLRTSDYLVTTAPNQREDDTMPAVPPPDGVYVPVPTFFKRIDRTAYKQPQDLDAQTEHTLFLAEAGITGLILCGSTGESVHMSRAEQVELIRSQKKALVENCYENVVIMAGTATQNIDETIAVIADSKNAGADYALVLTPSYFANAGGYSEEGLRAWYAAVADQSALPVLVYNYPAVTNNLQLPLSLMKHLSKHPNIVGCKLSHGNMSHHLILSSSPDIDHANFRVFTGLGQQLLPLLLSGPGAAGAIDGSAAYFPRSLLRIFTLARKIATTRGGVSPAEWQEVQKLQCAYSEVEEWVVKHGTVGIKEAIKKTLGISEGQTGARLPFCESHLPEDYVRFQTYFETMQMHEGKL
ncbi:hypothetical protein Dda_6340 [Drechslerella dactyloides]|uniref:Dihydrodipicolinate synthase n=1 Tax=Drechslerella dactyloides TaxID=74499 RepID=A0AAD6IX26_DREDA|nr:hypothetical protein Dda_6340 [Drechslerella dactyloides]